MNDNTHNGFVKAPFSITDGIPIFSQADRYTENYRRIAADHLAAMTPHSDNPYIENTLWEELEASTRAMITEFVPLHSRVLDVGVGLGRLMGPMPQYRRFGIDISLDYLRIARARDIDVAFARVEDMPYPDATFDAIVSCDVLEHITEFDLGVKQISRVLKSGGYLIIRVPYREELAVYLQEGLPYEFIHLRNFDEYSVRLYFEKIHKFSVRKIGLVANYWQGEARLRYRLPTRNASVNTLLSDIRSAGFKVDEEGDRVLRGLTTIYEEDLVAWINRIKEHQPEIFKLVQKYLIREIEMNVVLQKKLDE